MEKEGRKELVIRHLYKVFGKKVVLKNISFNVNKGDIFGIVGTSGAGKTVLLKTIVNFYQPSEGQILFKGKSITKTEARQIFGFSVQDSSFYPELTVKENLMYFGKFYDISTEEIKKRTKELLHLFELEGAENKTGAQLSGGMQKRLDIACALIHKPEMLLLDEPTSELDMSRKKDVLKLIQSINKKGVTVVIATLPMEVEQICDKLMIVENGAMVKQEDVAKRLKELYPKNFCQPPNKFKLAK